MKKSIVQIVIIMLFSTSILSVVSLKENDVINEKPPIENIDWWPMFHHDLLNTGYTSSSSPTSNQKIWDYSMNGFDPTSPSIFENKVYIGTGYEGNGWIYCLDINNGEELWVKQVNGEILTSPCIVEDSVFITTYNGYVYSLNTNNGTINWEILISDNPIFSSIICKNQKLYFGSINSKIYCLNATNGLEIWSYPTALLIKNSPALLEDRLYIGSLDSKIYCFDADPSDEIDEGIIDPSGSSYDLIWTHDTGGGILESSPAISNGNLYIGNLDNHLICINSSSGTYIWSYQTNGHIRNTPAVAYNNIYFGSDDGNIYCLNAINGSLNWQYNIDDDIRGSIAIADEKIFIPSDQLICLDAFNGNFLLDYNISVDASSPAIVNGKLFIGGIYGKIHCFGELPNQPPEIPATPLGQTEGEPDVEYTFTTSTTDPDEDDVYYMFDWGNGEFSEWLGPYASGDEIEASYTWIEEGTYDIKVKAKDTLDQETEYSDAHTIEIAEVPDPEPVLSIKSIEGGTGITAVIENTGDADATDVEWTITIEGGFFILTKEATDVIESIEAGEDAEITMSVFGIGLGIITDMPVITVSAECAEGSSDSDSAEAKIILSKVTIQ